MQSDDVLIGFKVLNKAVLEAKNHFNERLLACYALGSLAHGGFSLTCSDIDFAIIIQDPLQEKDGELIATIQSNVIKSGMPLSERLSIFWSGISSLRTGNPEGRFPLADRTDLIQHGKKLFGKDIVNEVRKPSKKALLVDTAKLTLHYLCSKQIIDDVANPLQLLSKDISYIAKLTLFPVRLLYALKTGQFGLIKEAVSHYLATNQGDEKALIESIFLWRDHPPSNPFQLLDLMQCHLRIIYVEFLDAYHAKMQDYHEHKLADQFIQWKNVLLDLSTC